MNTITKISKTIEDYIDSNGQILTKTTYNLSHNSYGKIYYENNVGVYHRLDGPAIIWPWGTEFWFKDGLRHRADGPAVIYCDGVEEYYLNGEKVSKKEVDLYWLRSQAE